MSSIRLVGVRWRWWPPLVALLAMQACIIPGRTLAQLVLSAGPPGWLDHLGAFVLGATLLQGAFALVAIAVMRRVLPAADPNLRWPPGRTDFGLAVAIGVGMGAVMFVADQWPLLIARRPPLDYPLDPVLASEWGLAMLLTGFGEEPLFRGLVVGMLAAMLPGRVVVGRVDVSLAAVIGGLLFALAHWEGFLYAPLSRAVAQQLYAFTWGLVYVWQIERTRSLAPAIVAHGIGNFVEFVCVVSVRAAWE